MVSQHIPQTHCRILLERRACLRGASVQAHLWGGDKQRGSMEAKVIIGTRVTGWSGCKEMIRTISGLASLQT